MTSFASLGTPHVKAASDHVQQIITEAVQCHTDDLT